MVGEGRKGREEGASGGHPETVIQTPIISRTFAFSAMDRLHAYGEYLPHARLAVPAISFPDCLQIAFSRQAPPPPLYMRHFFAVSTDCRRVLRKYCSLRPSAHT